MSRQRRKELKEFKKANKKYINNKNIDKSFPKQTPLPDNVVIQANDIWKIIVNDNKRYELLKGLNVIIYDNSLTMIFGESGSGKTTLISLLSALERPSEGNVNMMGYNTCCLNNFQLTSLRKELVGYIFQQYGLLKDITVFENIILTLEEKEQRRLLKKNKQYKKAIKRVKSDKYQAYNYSSLQFKKDIYTIQTIYNLDFYYYNEPAHISFFSLLNEPTNQENGNITLIRDQIFAGEYIYEIMKLLEIDHLINYDINKLSGGQQQRVSITRAVAKKPKLLFADEPTGAVDAKTAKSILKLFIKLRDDYGTSIVMVTHNINLIPIANRVITIESGTIANDVDNIPIDINQINFE